jgi:hypothetical protein
MADWDTESGLVEKFDGTVVDAFFEEGEYGVTLKLTVESPNLGNDTELWFSCGKKGIEYVSDQKVDVSLAKNGRFNDQSGVGLLISSLKKNPALISQVSSKGGPDEASSYKGLKARWERLQFGEKQDGTPRYATVPVDTYGAAQADTAGSDDAAEIPGWLMQLCSTAATYDEFVENALAHDDIDRATRKLVMDETLWEF